MTISPIPPPPPPGGAVTSLLVSCSAPLVPHTDVRVCWGVWWTCALSPP